MSLLKRKENVAPWLEETMHRESLYRPLRSYVHGSHFFYKAMMLYKIGHQDMPMLVLIDI